MPARVLSANRFTTPLQNRAITISLATLITSYLFTRILQVLPFSTPSTPIVAREIFSAFAFALIHGAQHDRFRGILVFAGVSLVISNIIENIGVLTGFPYGHYEFLPLMGPQLFHVPILLGCAYIGMAYVSWTLARLILRAMTARPEGAQLITLPLLASFIMTAWDFAQDPVWSTLLHAWRWRDGGIWFGVPLTNYAGWLLTVFLIYFAFAQYLRRRASVAAPALPHWRAAVLLYALCALGNVLQLLRRQALDVVVDPAGAQWHTAALLRASAFVSVFMMGSFALVAWLHIPRPRPKATN
ncbi:MAG TPA: carotenoid biosynthesis protein [Chthonomonadales bacterium]|nr:carotenoid biosynthesis protein [Chthonomonadales bacterium]